MPLRDRLLECLALKALPRAGWVRAQVPAPESVAAHSWGVAWLVVVLCPPGLDRLRALELAIVHDLPEVRVGDLTPHDPTSPADKHAAEHAAMQSLADDLPDGPRLVALWAEYDAGQSPEARFVKACDKLDMALQAAAYEAASPGLELGEFVDSALARLEDGALRVLAAGPHRP